VFYYSFVFNNEKKNTMPLPLSSADKIASYGIRGDNPSPSFLAIELSQAVHRINLINAWDPAIGPGTRVLELGCGQGTCTQALAEAVSAPEDSGHGHITAVDPGPPDYGAPFTLAQAQSHLSAGPLGPLVTFHRADPIDFLATNPDTQWDVAVLAHCIWYFPSADTLRQILSALRGRVARVCLAEWALHATEPAATAHVLAALARATFEAHRVDSTENIQTMASPRAIKEVVGQAGWKVETEGTVVPEAALSDGYWETGTVVDTEFAEDVEKEIKEERVKAVLASARDAAIAAADAAGGAKRVRSMDVWVATLILE
jgi:SAM-dependent methyltransferase